MRAEHLAVREVRRGLRKTAKVARRLERNRGRLGDEEYGRRRAALQQFVGMLLAPFRSAE